MKLNGVHADDFKKQEFTSSSRLWLRRAGSSHKLRPLSSLFQWSPEASQWKLRRSALRRRNRWRRKRSEDRGLQHLYLERHGQFPIGRKLTRQSSPLGFLTEKNRSQAQVVLFLHVSCVLLLLSNATSYSVLKSTADNCNSLMLLQWSNLSVKVDKLRHSAASAETIMHSFVSQSSVHSKLLQHWPLRLQKKWFQSPKSTEEAQIPIRNSELAGMLGSSRRVKRRLQCAGQQCGPTGVLFERDDPWILDLRNMTTIYESKIITPRTLRRNLLWVLLWNVDCATSLIWQLGHYLWKRRE